MANVDEVDPRIPEMFAVIRKDTLSMHETVTERDQKAVFLANAGGSIAMLGFLGATLGDGKILVPALICLTAYAVGFMSNTLSGRLQAIAAFYRLRDVMRWITEASKSPNNMPPPPELSGRSRVWAARLQWASLGMFFFGTIFGLALLWSYFLCS